MRIFEAFNIMLQALGLQLRGDVFVASYGDNELRFFTDELEEPELLGTFNLDTETKLDAKLIKEVTESI